MKKIKFLAHLISPIVVLIFFNLSFSQTPSKEPYVVGAFSSATGPAAYIGAPIRDGMMFEADLINEAGGINGRPIKLIFYDDASDPSKAVLVAKKLVEEDKVIALIGGIRSGNALAVVPYVERVGMPYIATAAATSLTQPVKKWTFADAVNNFQAVRKIIEYMLKRNITKIAFLPDNTAYGDDAYKSFMDQKPKSIDVLVHETFGDRDTDFTPQLIKVKAAGVQAAIVWVPTAAASIMMKNALMMGLNIPFFHCHGVQQAEYPILAGEGAKLMKIPSYKLLVLDQLPDTDPQKPILLAYRNEFVRRFRTPPVPFHGQGSDAVRILAGALKRVGWPPDKAKIRDEIEKTKNLAGLNGFYNITPTDHQGLSYESLVMVKWEKGNFIIDE